MNYAVIMAGGKGTRFWPLSRKAKPKQYLSLINDDSLLENTIDRLPESVESSAVYVVTSASQLSCYTSNMKQKIGEILPEPMGKNTAPCIAWAAWDIGLKDPDGVMIVLPSDHVVQDTAAFKHCISFACEQAQRNESLYTIGIPPTSPHTGYGYIEVDHGVQASGSQTMYPVMSFKEKPTLSVAKSYVESGRYYWNSGMFVWSVKAIKQAFHRCLPHMAQRFDELYSQGSPTQSALDAAYAEVESISIDYGILENSKDIVMIPASFDWSDIGSFTALAPFLTQHAQDNASNQSMYSQNSSGNIVISNKPVILLDTHDTMVIETDDAILIAPKSSDQAIKDIQTLLPESLL